MRFERSGTLVTDLISYDSEGHLLLEWMLTFDTMSPADQGFDPTVRRLHDTPGHEDVTLINLAHEKLAPFAFAANIDKELLDRAVYEVTVFSDVDGEDPHHVIVWFPLFEAASITGRGSCVFPCYDKAMDKVCLLKDSWRESEFDKEWETIRELNTAGVPHIPTLICASELPGQKTTIQDLVDAEWRIKFGDTEPIRARHHQRQLYKEVGRPLSTMKSSKELVGTMYHAFLGAFSYFLL